MDYCCLWLNLKENLFKNQSPDNFFSYSLEPVPALEPTPLWNQFQHLLEPELELESQLSEKTSKFGTGTDSRPGIATSLIPVEDWVRGRAPDSHARGREFESLRWLHPFSGACELCLLQYLETNGETGGVASYCKPRCKRAV